MNFTTNALSSDTVVIKIGDALDFRSADDFKAEFQEHLERDVLHYILDFSDTTVLDSTGLGSVFSLYRQVSPQDGSVVFADVSRPVQVVVQLTRTYKVFPQYASVDEAQDALLETSDE